MTTFIRLGLVVLGFGFGVVNLALAAVAGAALAIVGRVVFVRQYDGRLYVGNALFRTFLLAAPGIFLHLLEFAAVTRVISASASDLLMATSLATFGALLVVAFLKYSGLLRRIWPSAAEFVDDSLDRIFDV